MQRILGGASQLLIVYANMHMKNTTTILAISKSCETLLSDDPIYDYAKNNGGIIGDVHCIINVKKRIQRTIRK